MYNHRNRKICIFREKKSIACSLLPPQDCFCSILVVDVASDRRSTACSFHKTFLQQILCVIAATGGLLSHTHTLCSPFHPFTTMTASSNTLSLLDRLFSSCAGDPKGSVHRAWGLSLLFILGYFIMSIVESK
jgi:hypothetical protein